MNNSTTKKIAICGYGVMGSAIAKILRENMPDAKFTIIEQSETARNAAKAAKFDSIADPNRQFDAYWLCVKPQDLAELIKSLAARTRLENSLIISIAAGVSLERLAQWIYSNQHEQQQRSLRLVRVMPNLGLKLQAGAGALSWHTDDSADDWPNKEIREDDKKVVTAWLEHLGMFLEVKESLLDAVTALSGSGPAFVLSMLEALADAGVTLGLKRTDATALAARIVGDTAKLVTTPTGQLLTHPAILREQATSPGGTTAQGLRALARGNNFRSALMDAVIAAHAHAEKLNPAKLSDAGTTLSGSGPAFVLSMLEALADAGVTLGLKRTDATALAAHTVGGTAKLVTTAAAQDEQPPHPAILREQVTSPGGTTAHGLLALANSNNFHSALMNAVIAAHAHAKKLNPPAKQ